MPPLNWNAFSDLPGSAEANFEFLCRGIVRRQYGQFGSFRARAAQPGVEFHLRLNAPCDLGEASRWWGWQCRWYALDSGQPLGPKRRKKIEEALTTTTKVLPDITDWVLWTRHPLTAADQTWFYDLTTKMTLHLWTAAEVDNLLVGDAAILRSTYFGELVTTPSLLANRHQEAVAPILQRWRPEVHQATEAEGVLRRMLGEAGSWTPLLSQAALLRADADEMTQARDLSDGLEEIVIATAAACRDAALVLERVHESIGLGDLDVVQMEVSRGVPRLGKDIERGLRRLRSGGHRAALGATNGAKGLRHAHRLLSDVWEAFGARIVGVLADAGCGKTHLSAQLTAPAKDRPAGVLLHGRDLHARRNLDDLARRFVIGGVPVSSMESLVAAVDGAGQRAGARLPIVIDALNEAEDPRDWKPLLASLGETLRMYPYVLLVCTARPDFVNESLPDGVAHIEMPGFGEVTVEAIHAYFRHYKIEPADGAFPVDLLRHPLTLRLFCEVANPSREKRVGIEAIPTSLTGLFERYVDKSAERIAELSSRSHRHYHHDVRAALDLIGSLLWTKRARSVEMSLLRKELGDDVRPWDQSLVRALEQEGLLLRVQSNDAGSLLAPAYDALGGHLVANALLTQLGQAQYEKWLEAPATQALFGGGWDERHPLATDVFHSLVGLTPRKLYRRQLWELVSDPLRTSALVMSAGLEGQYLDTKTVEAIAGLVTEPDAPHQHLFTRLRQARGSEAHPLNAGFLDRCLRALGVGERDLLWSVSVRRTRPEAQIRPG